MEAKYITAVSQKFLKIFESNKDSEEEARVEAERLRKQVQDAQAKARRAHVTRELPKLLPRPQQQQQ
ncbi:hypothetical protein LTR55_012180, partial [Exophiala xenobiotica]